MNFAVSVEAASAGPVARVLRALGFRAEEGQVLNAAVTAVPAAQNHSFAPCLQTVNQFHNQGMGLNASGPLCKVSPVPAFKGKKPGVQPLEELIVPLFPERYLLGGVAEHMLFRNFRLSSFRKDIEAPGLGILEFGAELLPIRLVIADPVQDLSSQGRSKDSGPCWEILVITFSCGWTMSNHQLTKLLSPSLPDVFDADQIFVDQMAVD